MKNSNEVKNRIKSIKETGQITKAMNLISIIKMRKAMAKYEANKNYTSKLRESVKEIFLSEKEFDSKYFHKKNGNRVAYIVIASDRGLAGDYNNEVLELAYQDMKNITEKQVYSLGVLAHDYFNKRNIKTDAEYLHVMNRPILANARQMMYNMIELYDDDIVDEVKIAYTSMKNLNDIKAVVETVLPIDTGESQEENNFKEYQNLEYTCDHNETIAVIVRQYILGTIYCALLQSEVAEHYHRMVAMDSATRNSGEILNKLKLEYNKIRQEKITKEITETSSSRIRTE